MDYINYTEKLATIMGHILSDTHLLDLIIILLLYFTLPRVYYNNILINRLYKLVKWIQMFIQLLC